MELFWFAFDIPRYESKTSHLSMLQEGAYSRLMRHYYKTCAPIPTDQQQIVIITKSFSTDEIEAVAYVLKSFFHLESDGWHQDTCDEEIVKARRISKKRMRTGKLGGLAKARNLLQQKASKELDSNNNNNSNKELEPKAKAPSAFELPSWVPQEAWDHYTEMRNRIRKPMTDQAKKWAVKLLERLRNQGHDPRAVLEQSVFNSWQGLFEIRGEHGENRGNHQAAGKPHITAQHNRWAGNVTAVAAKYGLCGTGEVDAGPGGEGVGNQDTPDRTGSAPRLSPGNRPVVEGKVKAVSGSGSL